MAKWKDMNNHKVINDDPFTACNYDNVNDEFNLCVGPLRITLTREEKERNLKAWDKLEKLHKECKLEGDARQDWIAEHMK